MAGAPQKTPARVNFLKWNVAPRFRGFTLVEIMMVLVIVGILIALAIPAVDALRKRAERTGCVSQLRSLHGSFEGFLADNHHWPQMPPTVSSEEDFWKFWMSVLAEYGGGPEVWLCPTDKRLMAQGKALADEEPFLSASYVPTRFDSNEFTPYRWNQPWLVEKGDFHGGGPQMIMPNGDIRMAEQITTGPGAKAQ